MLDKDLFVKNMTGLCELFDKQLTESLLDIYYHTLCDLTDEQFKEGIMGVARSKKFNKMPLPGEILEHCGGGESQAILALDKAEKAAERYGSYVSVAFDDPVIHAVIQSLGGWPKFCRNDDGREWHWIQKEFIKLYETFAKHPRPDIPLVLTGICDLENSAAGRVEWLKGAKLIGSADAIKSWQEKLTGARPLLPEVKREDNAEAGTSKSLARS